MKKLLFGFVVWGLSLLAPALAANVNIDALPAASSSAGADLVECEQGGTNRKCTVDQVKAYTNTSAVRATTTTTEPLSNSDQNKLVTFSNAGAVAASIAQAGSGGNFAAGWVVSLRNLGAGTVTLTATTSFIDTAGNFTVVLTTGQGVDLYSDGTNYFTQPGKGGGGAPGGSSGQVQYNNSGVLGGFTMAGDCTLSQPNITCVGEHPGYVSGAWYGPPGLTLSMQGGPVYPANQIGCRMQIFPRLVTINSLGVGINAAGTSNIQLAIYNNAVTANGNRPGTLIGNTGSISNVVSPNTAISGAMAANKQVGPGGADGGKFLWMCMNQNDSTASFASTANNNNDFSAMGGDPTLGNLITGAANDGTTGVLCGGGNCQGGSSTFGSWPANLSTSTWTIVRPGTTGNVVPLIFFKVN